MVRPQTPAGSHLSDGASVFAFQNGRRHDEAGAKLTGNRHAGHARHLEGEGTMRTSATAPGKTNFVGQTNFVRIKEDEAAQSFSAVVIDFDAATLSRIAGRHIETAKLWKAGKRCPNSSSLINLLVVIPEIHGWLAGEADSRRPRAAVTAHGASAELGRLHARLQQEAAMPGERGVIARSILSDLTGGPR